MSNEQVTPGVDDFEDPVDRALALYARTEGSLADIPSKADSGVVTYEGDDIVVLRNIRGVLAAYLIGPFGGLHEMDTSDLTRLDEWGDDDA
jgi:hypothetical protein